MVFDQAKTMKIASTLGWFAIALSVLIMLASGALKLALLTQDPLNADEFDVRYIQQQWVSLLHIVPGVLFLTLAPLHFFPGIRQRRISMHRGLGRILATRAAISGVIVLILIFLFPTFGGISTQSATAFFGVIFLFSLFMAMRHMFRKEVRQHREWIIRTFSLAMAVATVRVFLILLQSLIGLSQEKSFGASFGLGFSVNLVVAEAWIDHTRRSNPMGDRS